MRWLPLVAVVLALLPRGSALAAPLSDADADSMARQVLNGDFTQFERLNKIAEDAWADYQKDHLPYPPVGQKVFAELADADAKNSANAREALIRATSYELLQSEACDALGVCAGHGDAKAFEVLSAGDKYGLNQLNVISGMGEAAKLQHPGAIAWLDDWAKTHPVDGYSWSVVEGLAPAAEKGDDTALDGIIILSKTTNELVHRESVRVIRLASNRGNAKATQALVELGLADGGSPR